MKHHLLKQPLLLAIFSFFLLSKTAAQTTPHPILFCTQVPQPTDFTTLMSVFGNQQATLRSAPRGGDLYIRYPNGNLKNLTQTAGYGENGFQGASAIAVRDPHVHWSGTKAVFSMVVGAVPIRYQQLTFYWQLYEITGLGENDTPVITKVPHQPPTSNNIEPIYGTDERIIFTTDLARNRALHLSPQHDEYESSPTVSGIWKLNPYPCLGEDTLQILTHAPSGDFTPIIDSYGRVIFSRWDHLKRDQQEAAQRNGGTNFGVFNYLNETDTATTYSTPLDIEVFPEPVQGDLLNRNLPEWDTIRPHNINIFNPWMMHENGTELEFVNHLGRHEMGNYFDRSFLNDPNLMEFLSIFSTNPNPVQGMIHIKESVVEPGVYYATDAPEFGTHAAGMIMTLKSPPGQSPEVAEFTYITHPETAEAADPPPPEHTGLYRNPVPLSDGKVLVMHTPETRFDANEGTFQNPISRYDFKLKLLEADGDYFKASATALTGAGISKSVIWLSPDDTIRYNGLLWETHPVEVVARAKPINPTLEIDTIPTIEQGIFADCSLPVEDFQRFLKRNNIALAVTRDVTSRDDLDKQQPYNLRIANGGTETIDPNSNDPSRVYELEYMQYFQADQIRGIGGINSPNAGRRPLAMPLHDDTAMRYNPPTTGPEGSQNLHPDGSVAVVLPAERAIAWQLLDTADRAIVRERVWLSFVPGEVRVCTSCHGESEFNQAGLLPPTNAPEALTNILTYIKAIDTDMDGTNDIYDFYPENTELQVGTPVSEDFVNDLSDWLATNGGSNDAEWGVHTSDSCYGKTAVADNFEASSAGTSDELTQAIDLEYFTEATLQFDVAYARYNADFSDGLKVKLIPCDGGNEIILFEKNGSDLATVPDQTMAFIPTDCSQWRTECIDLTDYGGHAYELVFENVSGGGNNLYLDNIRLMETVDSLSLKGEIQNVVFTQTFNNISSIARVLNGADATYQAGASIDLGEGFEVELGAVFEARIKECMGN